MNLAIRGLAVDLGKTHGDTFANDQFPDLKFDYIMANPPFNISDWNGEKYENDVRWKYGRPPVGNANYAWLQHMMWKLKSGGQAGIVLANGSMSSNTSNERQIRESMIKGDVVEAMIALPGQLFFNTQIPCCLWFLTNDKTKNGRDRRNETLFIDAKNLGTMQTRVLKVLTHEDIRKIKDAVSSWKTGSNYEDVKGFCKSIKIEEIEKNSFALNPGRYVGFVDQKDDGVPFEDKIQKLYKEFDLLQNKNNELNLKISKVLKNIIK
jgi:type I restriction enzyme M protein